MEWWKSIKYRINPREEIKDAIMEYYGNCYKPDRDFNEISDFKQTSTVQKYVNYINRHNIYVKMNNHYLINIIWNSITPCLRQAIAYYKDLH